MCAQLCPTFHDPMACCLPGSSVDGIFQARILKWVTISYSRGFSRPMGGTCNPGVEPATQEWNPHPLQFLHFLLWQVGSLPLATWKAPSFSALQKLTFPEMDLYSHQRHWHLGVQNSLRFIGDGDKGQKDSSSLVSGLLHPMGKEFWLH